MMWSVSEEERSVWSIRWSIRSHHLENCVITSKYVMVVPMNCRRKRREIISNSDSDQMQYAFDIFGLVFTVGIMAGLISNIPSGEMIGGL